MCLQVDDLLITCESEAILESVYGQLQEHYKDVKIQRRPKLSYLGMTLDFSRAGLTKCTTEGYIADLLEYAGHTERRHHQLRRIFLKLTTRPL